MSTENPWLCIIFPAYNEEHRLPPTLAQIDHFLSQQSYTAEVIIVDNGSTDHTAAVVQSFVQKHPYIRFIQARERGKGLAVREGMLAAKGAYRFICDADLSMPIEEVSKFLPPEETEYDVLIGSREGPQARRIGEPEYRHIMGRILNWIVKITAVRGFEDTQCGFKMFGQVAAEDLFSVQQMNGIGFDVELIYIAKKRGYKIKDIPITWYFNDDSRMRLVQDSLHILIEIWQIRQNWRRGVYDQQKAQHQNRKPQT